MSSSPNPTSTSDPEQSITELVFDSVNVPLSHLGLLSAHIHLRAEDFNEPLSCVQITCTKTQYQVQYCPTHWVGDVTVDVRHLLTRRQQLTALRGLLPTKSIALSLKGLNAISTPSATLALRYNNLVGKRTFVADQFFFSCILYSCLLYTSPSPRDS